MPSLYTFISWSLLLLFQFWIIAENHFGIQNIQGVENKPFCLQSTRLTSASRCLPTHQGFDQHWGYPQCWGYWTYPFPCLEHKPSVSFGVRGGLLRGPHSRFLPLYKSPSLFFLFNFLLFLLTYSSFTMFQVYRKVTQIHICVCGHVT